MGTRSDSEGELSNGCNHMDCPSGEVPPKKVRCGWQVRGNPYMRGEGLGEEPQLGHVLLAARGRLETPKQPSYLRMWQVQQEGRSYMDNVMNCALEHAYGGPFCAGSLEDTAVVAAMRNHGLRLPHRLQPPICSECTRPSHPPVNNPLEHTTFMDAAVMVAIERKGLSSLPAADV